VLIYEVVGFTNFSNSPFVDSFHIYWFQNAYGIQLFSTKEKPFGTSYDDWVSKYWNWDVGISKDEWAKNEQCKINNSNAMVMLLDTVVDGSPDFICKISSQQGIMIPMWIAECDNGNDFPNDHGPNLDQRLTECAKARYNLGNIKSDVTVDGHPIAGLNVRQSLIPGSKAVDYKVSSIANVTNFSSKGFTITFPPDTHEAGVKPGTFRSGSQGWWVFLRPLPPGEHIIHYNIRVTPTGPITSPGTNPHFADITYKLQVAK
jgi:hypothetical protein